LGVAPKRFLAKSEPTDPRDSKKSLVNVDLVLKTYWPEASRTREEDIIDIAMKVKIEENNRRVANHFPDLICSDDFVGHSTGIISQHLGFPAKCDHVFRVIILGVFPL
jgi:hypothetical protein